MTSNKWNRRGRVQPPPPVCHHTRDSLTQKPPPPTAPTWCILAAVDGKIQIKATLTLPYLWNGFTTYNIDSGLLPFPLADGLTTISWPDTQSPNVYWVFEYDLNCNAQTYEADLRIEAHTGGGFWQWSYNSSWSDPSGEPTRYELQLPPASDWTQTAGDPADFTYFYYNVTDNWRQG